LNRWYTCYRALFNYR